MTRKPSEELKDLIAEVLRSMNTLTEIERSAEQFLLGPVPEERDWNSKRTYVLARLKSHSMQDLVATARRILEHYPAIPQRQGIARLIPKLVKPEARTRILDELAHIQRSLALPLSGKMSADELVKRMGSSTSFNTHVANILGIDYVPRSLIEELHLTDEIDEVFFRFLEAVTHPLGCVDAAHQSRLVTAINKYLVRDGFELSKIESLDDLYAYGVHGILSANAPVKKIIFAASEEKPDLIATDVLSGDLDVVASERVSYLVYAEEIPDSGLKWSHLVEWWEKRLVGRGLSNATGVEAARSLYKYLYDGLQSKPEKNLFHVYCKLFPIVKTHFPALIPQFYLRWDPHTGKKVRVHGQRYDFLLLLPAQTRVILEVDGIQHYARLAQEGPRRWQADPESYTRTVRDTRDLLLSRYAVYRFSTQELGSVEDAFDCLSKFFRILFSNHGIW